MKLQVQLESEVGREMFATLVTPAHRASSAACNASWHWQSVPARMSMCRRCLENKHAFVRSSYIVDGDNVMTIFNDCDTFCLLIQLFRFSSIDREAVKPVHQAKMDYLDIILLILIKHASCC